jgi:hypothetical protein
MFILFFVHMPDTGCNRMSRQCGSRYTCGSYTYLVGINFCVG